MTGSVTSLTITDSGFGYTTAPNITISAPDLSDTDATASATVVNGAITTVTMTDSGAFYNAPPTVTVALPDADSAVATATGLIDSDGATIPGSLFGVTLVDSGAYYTSAPTVTVEANHNKPKNWVTSYSGVSAKFGDYSHKNTFDYSYLDSDYNNFSNDGPGAPERIDFWLNIPAGRNGTIMRFPGHEDSSAAAYNAVEVETRALRWRFIVGSSGASLVSPANSLTSQTWHHIQLQTKADGGHRMFIDGNIVDNTDPGATAKRLISGTVRFSNGIGSDGIMVDAFRYSKDSGNAVQFFGTGNLPDSDRSPYDSGEDGNLDYLGFELKNPSLTATVVNGEVQAYNILRKGNYLDSVNIIVDSATGGPADFRATLVSSVDSAAGGVVSLSIVDSGGFYESDGSAVITIDSDTKATGEDYRATGGTTIDANGRIDTLFVNYAGGGYSTAPTVTIQDVPALAVSNNDPAEQTLASGVKVSGEIVKYSDSDGKLYLAHVGADDGLYHTFVSGRDVVVGPSNAQLTRDVKSVTELNKISNNEQNDDFATISDDFLDFSEANPFGDPS